MPLVATPVEPRERAARSPAVRRTRVREELDIREAPTMCACDKPFVYRIRLPFTAVCLLSGAAMALRSSPWIDPGSWTGLGVSAAGIGAIGAGVAVRMWAISSISERKTHRLVVTGAYSLCRNPLYVGTLCIVVGFLALWQSVPLALLAVPPMLLYPWGVVPFEERTMALRHAGRYLEYQRRTPRWVPRFSSYVRESRPTFRSVGVWREGQSGLWWLGLALLSVWLCHWRWDAL